VLALRGARHDGESTPGTFFAWDNDIETRAYAAYMQGEYQFTDRWALTLGVRYARDEKKAEERLIGIQESLGLTAFALFDAGSIFSGAAAPSGGTLDYIVNNPDGFAACGSGANLLCLYNAVNGAIDPTTATQNGGIAVGDQGTNPGDEPVWFSGVPIAFNIYRPVPGPDAALGSGSGYSGSYSTNTVAHAPDVPLAHNCSWLCRSADN
jgi:hypothetical protein